LIVNLATVSHGVIDQGREVEDRHTPPDGERELRF
jgi:hypothetical protein